MKNSIISICLVALSLICLSACVLRYWQLDRVPYGFHIDELATAVDVGCMATEGVDAHNVSHPLFSGLNYGTPKPPTYIYPAMLWAKIFGYSVFSLRVLSVTVYSLGIAGLFFGARSLFGWRYALLTLTVACLSPWTWGISRVAFEPLFAMTFLIWALYFFIKPPQMVSTVLAGLFFSASMYSYPPFRLAIPLMLLSLIIYTYRSIPRARGLWATFVCAVATPSIPLIWEILNGGLQQRFNKISIFSKDYLNSMHLSGNFKDLIGIFINNYSLHFSKDFLFLTGDPSYVHSTRHFGILSWLDMAAVVFLLIWALMLLFKKYRNNNPLVLHKYFICFLVVNIFIGVIPSALTTEELPNSLRIIGAWPFMCLLSGFLIWQACERWWWIWIGTCVLSIFFALLFFNIYFNVFPQEGKGMFSYWTLEEANQIKSDDDWLKFLLLYRYQDYNARYFLMQYRGLSCTQSRNTWEGMRELLKSRGKYY